MSVFNASGNVLTTLYKANGTKAQAAFDINGTQVFSAVLPIPSGDLTAASVVPLPDLYEVGKGFTCTGLAYDAANNTFLVGDIGILLPNSGTIQSQLVRVSSDFTTVVETIPLYTAFPNMSDVQGVAIDTSDGSVWVCSPSENLIRNITAAGASIGSIAATRPTGVAYDPRDDTLWVLNYSNSILHLTKDGTVLATHSFSYSEALDQCFLDVEHGYLYITAGTNYSSRNNVYLFNTETSAQSIACTVDSYSVEGIWIGVDRMVIVNDGYYHSASDGRNVANIYNLGGA